MPYSPLLLLLLRLLQDIEQLLKQWATTFQISDTDLMQRLTDATSGDLQRPPDR